MSTVQNIPLGSDSKKELADPPSLPNPLAASLKRGKRTPIENMPNTNQLDTSSGVSSIQSSKVPNDAGTIRANSSGIKSSPGLVEKTYHTIQGSTIHINYDASGDNVVGEIVILNYPDRPARVETIDGSKSLDENHPEGPQGVVTFDLSKNNLTKEERLQIIKQLEKTLNVGRGKSPQETDFAFLRGRDFDDLLNPRSQTKKGKGGLTITTRRKVTGLFNLDSDPEVKVMPEQNDVTYQALQDFANTLSAKHSNGDWQINVKRSYVDLKNQTKLEQVKNILAGARELTIRIEAKDRQVGESYKAYSERVKKVQSTFGVEGSNFYEIEYKHWDNGHFLMVNAGRPKIDGKPLDLWNNMLPAEAAKTPQQRAFDGDGRSRLFVYLGNLKEPLQNIERTLFKLTEKLASDHEHTSGGEYLFRDSELANSTLQLCDGQRKKGDDLLSSSASLIGINDAVLHGCSYMRLGLGDFIKRCHVRDSFLGLMGRRINLWDNDIDNSKIALTSTDGKNSLEYLSVRGGYCGKNTQVYGGVKGGNLEGHWHCNMLGLKEFGVKLYDRWGIIQKWWHLRGSYINPAIVTDVEWGVLVGPIYPFFQNWGYRHVVSKMANAREIANRLAMDPTIGTGYLAPEECEGGTWGQASARMKLNGKDGEFLFEIYVNTWDNEKNKRDRSPAFMIVQTNLADQKEGGAEDIYLGDRDLAGQIWIQLLGILGSNESIEHTCSVVESMREELNYQHKQSIEAVRTKIRGNQNNSTMNKNKVGALSTSA